MTNPLDFEDLFPPPSGCPHPSALERRRRELEGEVRRLIAQVNFWHSYHDEARRRALEKAREKMGGPPLDTDAKEA